ncbi:1-acyl-sn-glycerol-3-phosphate acyltransferase [Tahibacter aquaticus]|uniref:1-acyl-sn-glycerol-3-phosphate acyltransferase n=1 Tax=Tahibacter aquaticus TaxID=520092 RepID=A0A4R6Z2A7_9GAMM|nr:acyltransferase [Tahibacter aquaticus]TDR45735.1 1-acyl-sn-glycerol-3-phosphate acyltransferase [Tahibacter aquaticus]
MLSILATPLRVGFSFSFIAANTVLHATPLLLLALLKLALPLPWLRRQLSYAIEFLARSWIDCNSLMMCRIGGARIVVHGQAELQAQGWYLVLCNHQSWVDIPVLQHVFNHRIPILKFFLKRELIWVPLLGLAWWALDFPFMRRYTRQQLEKNPQLRGKDREATRRACEKFRDLPVSVMNFVEGTRFTPAKQAQQGSPYAHLLLPRAGGVAFVLDAMGNLLQSLVDVTIVYPQGRPGMIDLLAGRVREVRVHLRSLPIPPELLGGDYDNDEAFRTRFQHWLNELWREKEATAAALENA